MSESIIIGRHARQAGVFYLYYHHIDVFRVTTIFQFLLIFKLKGGDKYDKDDKWVNSLMLTFLIITFYTQIA